MSLDELRAQLSDIDRDLIELIAKRQHLALEIGRVKRTAGVSTRNFRQERVVLQRAREAAEESGLSPDVAQELMLLLIRSSLTVQEKQRVAAGATGTGKRVLVIGGSGNMGRWFVRFLSSQEYQVELADPNQPDDSLAAFTHYSSHRESDLEHEIIVVAASMEPSRRILHDLAEIRPKGLVFDVCSLKSPIRSGLKALARTGVKVASLHPMFGPSTELLSGRHVVFIDDLGVPAANDEARELFAPTMATLVEMGLESHDRFIAYVLGLSHALNIAFFTALAESGETAPKLAELSSTTFDAQLDVAKRVADESPRLYYEIQALNDYGTESLSALLYAVERLRSVVRAGDERGFTALMERGREYLQNRRNEVP
ncbi:MAG: prephenate dehydrogenase/arogenate dehydrogenase family protein [Proteobacteria bacterium]|nr:prephenate dehydrogenase/arogenate dehydrogenase family protein [Pseudomonadota bacterium]